MTQVLFYLFIKPLSRLPLAVLYRLSDALYLLLYYVLPYRKSVVLANIEKAFPEKTAQEKQSIAKKFYRHFCSLLMEVIRAFSIPGEELGRRTKILNPDLLSPFYEQGRDVIIVAGHYTNWEMLVAYVRPQIKHDTAVLYAPLSNKFIDQQIQESRSRFGLQLIPRKEVKPFFESKNRLPTAFVFANDQSPSKSQTAYWTQFLNQDTAVQFGAEKYAKAYDCVVVFAHLRCVRRGYYEATFQLISEHPNEMPHGRITELHTQAVERNILEAPQYWLWTHKRWKLKRQD